MPPCQYVFNNEFTETYDAFVFWDIGRKITEEHKQDFINMLKKGKGCVFLHHSIMSYQDWDEYAKIVGGRYLHDPVIENGKEIHPALIWELDQSLNMKIEDKNHPVTQGIEDFIAHDETYKKLIPGNSIHLLMSTDNPKNSKPVSWTNHYGNSRIVYIQLGHGSDIFQGRSYKKLVEQSIH